MGFSDSPEARLDLEHQIESHIVSSTAIIRDLETIDKMGHRVWFEEREQKARKYETELRKFIDELSANGFYQDSARLDNKYRKLASILYLTAEGFRNSKED